MTPEILAAMARQFHVVTADGTVLRAGRACLFVLGELGWPVRPLAWPPLVWFVEGAYRLVAANRQILSRFIRRTGSCPRV